MVPALTPCPCRYKHPSGDQHGAGAQHCHAHWGERLQPAAAPDQRAARLRDHLHQWHPPLPRYGPLRLRHAPGLGECAWLMRGARGVLPIPGAGWVNPPCAPLASLQGGGNSGREQLCPSMAALGQDPFPMGAVHASIPGFLWLILSSFSFLFSSQLKAPRWQTPSSRPTPACSTMQVSNLASHSFPLSPLCSSLLFLGGEPHPGVEHWTGAVYLGMDS